MDPHYNYPYVDHSCTPQQPRHYPLSNRMGNNHQYIIFAAQTLLNYCCIDAINCRQLTGVDGKHNKAYNNNNDGYLHTRFMCAVLKSDAHGASLPGLD